MTTLSRITPAVILGLTLFLSSVSAHAGEMTFTPRASLSIASYEFTQTARPGALAPTNINNNDFPEVKFEVTFKIFGVGGTFIKDDFYLDLALQQSLNEEDDFTLTDPNLALPNNTFTETFKGDRQDSSITLGRKFLNKRAALYLGYKTGKSEASGNQGQHLLFEEDGFFIGANYAWVVGNKGAVSVNLAYADLDGELVEDVTNPAFASPPLNLPLDTNAASNAQGLSYGVTWSSRLSKTLSYSLGLDARSYTFEDVTNRIPNTANPSSEFKEEFLSTTFSLFFVF